MLKEKLALSPNFNKSLFIEDNNFFNLNNRRYLGNKYKLLDFIDSIVTKKCDNFQSFCDIFSGTGVVGNKFNKAKRIITSNDILNSNYICLNTFLNTKEKINNDIIEKINYLNNLKNFGGNYFSRNFGGNYFSIENAIKIGAIREEITKIANNTKEKEILICSLLYAVDKIANTVGHYDAFMKKSDSRKPLKLFIPNINYKINTNNQVFREDANILINKIYCDVLYIDPPYNSRQYSDTYHLLENLSEWNKPRVKGIAKKMDRSHIKSNYCLKNAKFFLEDLVKKANCKHILLSYNNTAHTKNDRSNVKINDSDIIDILGNKGIVEIFEQDYKVFTTTKSDINVQRHTERIFYCKVTK